MLRNDLTGQRFARLTVQKFHGRDTGRRSLWLCLCDCGNTRIVEGHNLKCGHTQSCGCLREEITGAAARLRFTTHGHCRDRRASRTYRSWLAALTRCYNKNAPNFPRYGQRGIRMCARWRHSFENFLADMGGRPLGKSLDRYPNPDGNYEPKNCRWASPSQQARNKSKLTGIVLNRIRRAAQVFTRAELTDMFNVPRSVIAVVVGETGAAHV